VVLRGRERHTDQKQRGEACKYSAVHDWIAQRFYIQTFLRIALGTPWARFP
jgi:hypothetical protein